MLREGQGDAMWGGDATCGNGTSERRQNKKKKKKLTKWPRQMCTVAGVDEPGRGEGELDTVSSWLRHQRRVGAQHGGMSRCQV